MQELTQSSNPLVDSCGLIVPNSKLKFYDGTKWRTTGGAEISATSPAGLAEGDFWWDTNNEQLYAYNGTSFIQ